MARFIIEGITLEQAKELASWYDGSGEQHADDWFDANNAGRAPFSNAGQYNKEHDCIGELIGEDVVLKCS